MELASFSDSERQALLELLVLGMYADGHLASAEDETLQQVVATLGFSSEYHRNQFVDELFTRVSRVRRDPQSLREHAAPLMSRFDGEPSRQHAVSVLQEFLSSDGALSEDEQALLAVVKELAGASSKPGLD